MKAGFAAWLCLIAVSRVLAIDAPLILVSLDGFRWDYCEQHPAESPTLRELKREGVSARRLIPVFPSNTFPNHSARGYLPGDHGYDPSLPSMQGVFIAHGPAFRHGVEIPAAENVHLYNLMCSVLGLKAAPNDGDDRLVRAALRPATRSINGNTAKD